MNPSSGVPQGPNGHQTPVQAGGQNLSATSQEDGSKPSDVECIMWAAAAVRLLLGTDVRVEQIAVCRDTAHRYDAVVTLDGRELERLAQMADAAGDRVRRLDCHDEEYLDTTVIVGFADSSLLTIGCCRFHGRSECAPEYPALDLRDVL